MVGHNGRELVKLFQLDSGISVESWFVGHSALELVKLFQLDSGIPVESWFVGHSALELMNLSVSAGQRCTYQVGLWVTVTLN